MPGNDLAALHACTDGSSALCTLVGIEGSFSRRLGAQVAVGRDGATVGSLSDGCLERQLASEAQAARHTGAPALVRFGAGSRMIDFRLPCGSGLDILIDPAPDYHALARARAHLRDRRQARVALPLPAGINTVLLDERVYHPTLRILAFGEGPELVALGALATTTGAQISLFDRHAPPLTLGQPPRDLAVDRWTAIVLLFHDHEWEQAILTWAARTPAFYIGAQGGARARVARTAQLLQAGVAPTDIERIRSPIGLIAQARDPQVLALSVLAEIVADYERLPSLNPAQEH